MSMTKLHVDTDLGSDPDDVCALVYLLGRSDVEITGVTTVMDPGGRRVGYVRRVLELAGRPDIPVAAGAEVAINGERPGGIPDDGVYWPGHPVGPCPGSPGQALDRLEASIEAGATIVALGPFTNLALLAVARPGLLAQANLVVMGGWVDPAHPSLPQWGAQMDWNVQCDTMAAEIVARMPAFTMVSLTPTLQAHLRGRDLPALRASGPLGRLIATQAEAHGGEYGMARLALEHAGLPRDLLNFQYDPVACAVAAGWAGATMEDTRLQPVVQDGVMWFERRPEGSAVRLVVDVDGAQFAADWLAAVEEADRRAAPAV